MNKNKDVKEVKKFKKNFILSIFAIDLITIIMLYYIMPIIQGYPPYSENFAFQEKVQILTHIEQYTIILIIGIILNLISMKIYMKRIYSYMNKFYRKEKVQYEEIVNVRNDCINVPYKLAIFELLGILCLGLILNFVMLAKFFAVVKFTLMIIALASVTALLTLLISQKFLYNILEQTYKDNKNYEMHNGYRIKNSLSLQIQIMPFIIVVLIIISLIGYTKAMDKQGMAITNHYKAYLNIEENEIDNYISVENLKKYLDKIPLYNQEDYYFIINPQDEVLYVSKEDGKISSFVIDYKNFFYDKTDGRLYENFGVDEQLYAKKIQDSNGNIWLVGFKFSIIDYELFLYYLSIDIVVIFLYVILSYIWAKSVSKNANRISYNLKEILYSKELNKDNILPIMSNDELGDLSYYYNKIQEKLIDQQDIISLQSKFSAIGEVAAGMAHDINNPASSIERTVNLLYEFEVNSDKEEYQLLLDNMKVAIERILKIVNNAREQFRNNNNMEKEEFTLNDLLKSIKQSEEYEIIKNKCKLSMTIDNDIKLYGIKSKLYQVLINLVTNSLNAYKDRNIQGEICIEAYEDKEFINIKVKDKAGGISKEIQNTLFKKIITTRGTKGTGLGLYLAANIIEIDFKGKIEFESEINNGTTFYIKIPKYKEEER